MPSIRGAICSALPKSLSEILELLAGFEFADRQAGNLDRFLQFGIAGSRASRSRPRTYHSQRRTAVGFSAVTTGKKIVKLTSANWHKNLPALPRFTRRTRAACTAEPSFSQSSSREMALSGVSSLSGFRGQ
jgi:hypothetical protein